MTEVAAPFTVPVVDIGGFESAGPARRQEIAEAADEAYRTIGFLQVAGHGVPASLIAAMQAVTTEYFDQPLETKLAHMRPPEANRGYSPPGAEALSYSAGLETPPDLFQAFNAGAQIHTVDPALRPSNHAALYHPNVWPDEPPTMRRIWEGYIAEVSALAQRMLRILATALDLDPEYLASQADQAPDVLRALDYRSFGGGDPEPGQMRLGAHSDYGMCTMLYADPVPGLQLLTPDGRWVDVVPIPGHYLVNVGDMLAAWTNDRYRSTVHRVVPAKPGQSVTRRSMAYFHEANPEAMIEPLPTCVDDDNPPRYESISAGDHLLAKVASARAMEPADAVQTTGDRGSALLSGAEPDADDA
ncbi:MAG: 2-oxoglutarate and iron-dependent oxygenase domain-containing protein [Actinomycetota bacterium]